MWEKLVPVQVLAIAGKIQSTLKWLSQKWQKANRIEREIMIVLYFNSLCMIKHKIIKQYFIYNFRGKDSHDFWFVVVVVVVYHYYYYCSYSTNSDSDRKGDACVENQWL